MSSPERSSGQPYSGYAENLIVRREADRPLLNMVSHKVHRAFDIGVGTGTGIEDMIEMGIVIQPYKIIGIDISEDNLDQARQKLQVYYSSESVNEISLQIGDAENLVGIPANSQELVLCRNMIHLTNAQNVFKEIYRILEPGGEMLVSSGYMSDKMYPPPEEVAKRRWGMILALGRQRLVRDHDFSKKNIPDPNLPDKYSSRSLIRYASSLGFVNIKTEEKDRVVHLDSDAIKGLILWDTFAQGAIPIDDVELAKDVLLKALDDHKLSGKKFPRGIFYLKAQKPHLKDYRLRGWST